MSNTQVHWSMRVFKGAEPLTIKDTCEIYEVPFSGPYDSKYMRRILGSKLIPTDVSELKEYIKAVDVSEWDKSLTIRVCLIRHYNDFIKELSYA